MPTSSQDKDFKDALIANSLLDEAIAWIAKNLSPGDVFEDEKLKIWAEENGYVISED